MRHDKQTFDGFRRNQHWVPRRRVGRIHVLTPYYQIIILANSIYRHQLNASSDVARHVPQATHVDI
jgi:hypothetical protein